MTANTMGDRQLPRMALILALLLLLIAVWSITVGTSKITLFQILDAFVRPDGSREHVVVLTLRLPRILAACLVGAALGLAGAIMQAVTGNPLASPGLLGVNAGAAFAVVVASSTLGPDSGLHHTWFAFVGAAAAATVVYGLGSAGRSGATPLKLTLAGAVVGMFLASLTTAALILDQTTLDDVRFWLTGSLSGIRMADTAHIGPYIGSGILAALLFHPQIMALSLGPDVARSIGQHLSIWRAVSALIVVLLAGSAVALAGPIGFIGLVVPHLVRFAAGHDYRRMLPLSALGGAFLLLLADTCTRSLTGGNEVPVGVVMAMIGAPFFIYLARYRISMSV